jgi:hypothetical protein
MEKAKVVLDEHRLYLTDPQYFAEAMRKAESEPLGGIFYQATQESDAHRQAQRRLLFCDRVKAR